MSYNLTTMQSIFLNNKEITLIKHNNKTVYHKSSGPDYSEPFYVENITNSDETLNIKQNSDTAPVLTIEYSTDKVTWSTLGMTSTTALTYTLQPGDKVYLRCNTNTWTSGSNSYNSINGVSKVGGNIMSLLYGNNFTGNETSFPDATINYIFCRLFYLGRSIIDASYLLLPVTTLANNCYYCMFIYCSSLIAAPELPATTLNNGCYREMFRSCTALTTAPALPATTILRSCYSSMFKSCSSLTTAPELPATTLDYQCYEGMFSSCTALTTAPELPATTLADYCYQSMFSDCTSLNAVKCLATNISASGSTNNWLSNVAASGTFTCANGMSQIWSTGVSGIPYNWTVTEV